MEHHSHGHRATGQTATMAGLHVADYYDNLVQPLFNVVDI